MMNEQADMGIWLMSGTTILSASMGFGIVDPAWTIQGSNAD